MNSSYLDIFNYFNNYFETQFINHFPDTLHDQIRYFISGGKRIRPILFLIFSGIQKPNTIDTPDTPDNLILLTIASIIELLHCLSLVIDDLPEMDNDSERRGKPSFHAKYGPDYTQFFIYYILNKIPMILNSDILKRDNMKLDNQFYSDILELFNHYINILIDGQYIDLEYDKMVSGHVINGDDGVDRFDSINTILIYDVILLCIEKSQSASNMGSGIRQNVILNSKKTCSLFVLSILAGYISQYWKNKIPCNLNIPFLKTKQPPSKKLIHNIKNLYQLLNTLDNNLNQIEPPDDYPDNDTDNDTYNDPDHYYNNIITILILWANVLGYLFQITDDLLDKEPDAIHNKPNFWNTCNITPQPFITHLEHWLIDQITTINRKIFEKTEKCTFNLQLIQEITNKIIGRVSDLIG